MTLPMNSDMISCEKGVFSPAFFKPELLRERHPRPQHCRVAALHAAGAVGCEQATNAVHEEYDEIIQMQGKPRLIPT